MVTVVPKTIAEITSFCTYATLQDFHNLLIKFKQNGLEIGAAGEEFLVYIKQIKKDKKSTHIGSRRVNYNKTHVIKNCPVCGNVMDLYKVNHDKRTQVGGEFKSQWYCNYCGESIYSKLSPNIEWTNLQRSK